jgi:hypothetical protein
MRVSERLDPNGRELRLVVIVGGEGRRKRLCHLDGGLLMEDGATIKKEGEKRRWPWQKKAWSQYRAGAGQKGFSKGTYV